MDQILLFDCLGAVQELSGPFIDGVDVAIPVPDEDMYRRTAAQWRSILVAVAPGLQPHVPTVRLRG